MKCFTHKNLDTFTYIELEKYVKFLETEYCRVISEINRRNLEITMVGVRKQ